MTLSAELARRDVSGRDDDKHDLAVQFQIASAVARSALERWRQAVRTVLRTTAAGGSASALGGLAAWYERMCVDASYAVAEPDEGLEALIALVAAGDHEREAQLAVTYWAVRVAHELAVCRAEWPTSGDRSDRHRVALAKLELALHGSVTAATSA